MKSILLFLFTLSLLFSSQCTSSGKKTEVPPGHQETTTVREESNDNSADEFIKAPEGFLNSDTFQVVISSLEGNADGAQDLARKRALNLLIAEKGEAFRPADKTILKELVESKGKIVKHSGSIQGKTYFLFQVSSPGLKSSLKR
ncbi:lipoprotein [Leptospira yasudae]|uniref:lipoprotein n=1 Tax=Leptospira yasudae TaxID=2202201 RepID=UPI00109137F1|nr:lipoprotein [Leptospira yasudae]MBW0432106.1 lipoprotein [Leptospira yasudae]TGN02446.1 lipoprotein [Leptospira yasudae]